MFKLVFKEYLTPNVMQITLINQVPYIGMCFMDIVSTNAKVSSPFGRRGHIICTN